jgi:PAS domain-containing protein
VKVFAGADGAEADGKALVNQYSDTAALPAESAGSKVDAAALSTCVVDMQSQILALSPMFATMLGSTDPDALLGRTLLDFVHPSSVAIIDTGSAFSAVHDGAASSDVRLVRLDGEELGTRCVIQAVEVVSGPARHLTFVV